jgi:nucleotide-binding universal stress UspA family protein
MTHVLAAMDDPSTAGPVLDTAVLMSRSLGATLRAVQSAPGITQAQARAAALGIELELLSGTIDETVLTAATDPAVGLVVIGLHREEGRKVPGHLVHALADRMRMPLVLVPEHATLRQAPSRVLFPIDGTLRVSAAARPFLATYVAAGYDVHALHVFEPTTVPRFHDGPEDEQVWRDEFVAEHFAELNVQLTTRAGPLVPVLLETAEQHAADIIALPTRPDASEDERSVIRQVLEGARCPVALVPMPPRGGSVPVQRVGLTAVTPARAQPPTPSGVHE